jgi:hypothetical protein
MHDVSSLNNNKPAIYSPRSKHGENKKRMQDICIETPAERGHLLNYLHEREANRRTAGQVTVRLSWNPKVHYHIHDRLFPNPTPSPDSSSPYPWDL